MIQRIQDWLFGYDFFICYRWQDAKFYAEHLGQSLAENYSCFMDTERYAPGDNLIRIGDRALRETGRLVLVGTLGIADSKHCKRELKTFRATGKRIIAIDFSGTIAQLRQGDSELAMLLNNDELLVRENEIDPSNQGPTEETIRKIEHSLSVELKRVRRSRTISAVSYLLTILLLASACLALTTRTYFVNNRANSFLRTALLAKVSVLESGGLHVAIRGQEMKDASVDIASLVESCQVLGDVERLEITDYSLINPESLAELHHLKLLNLRGCSGLASLKFVWELSDLDTLQLHSTGLNDDAFADFQPAETLMELKITSNRDLTNRTLDVILKDPVSYQTLNLDGCSGIAIEEKQVKRLEEIAVALQNKKRSLTIKVFATNVNALLEDRSLIDRLQRLESEGLTFEGLRESTESSKVINQS